MQHIVFFAPTSRTRRISTFMGSAQTRIGKVNKTGKFENAKASKAFFNALYEELIAEVNKQFEQLSELSKN